MGVCYVDRITREPVPQYVADIDLWGLSPKITVEKIAEERLLDVLSDEAIEEIAEIIKSEARRNEEVFCRLLELDYGYTEEW